MIKEQYSIADKLRNRVINCELYQESAKLTLIFFTDDCIKYWKLKNIFRFSSITHLFISVKTAIF